MRLSIESKNRVIIIEKLVGMLNDTGKSAQEQAAAALANLASDSAENRNSMCARPGSSPESRRISPLLVRSTVSMLEVLRH